jgi:hypothetical protein
MRYNNGWRADHPAKRRQTARDTEMKESLMRFWQPGLMLLPVVLLGCGGGDKPAATLSVTCDGSVALAGARSIDVLGDQVNGRTMLTFPDPANRGKTGMLPVSPRDQCTITPVVTGG